MTAEGEFVFSAVGGALCLDFTNTVSWRTGPDRTEHLVAYGDLLAWGVQRGALTEVEAEPVRRAAADTPEGADRALRQAVALRDAVFRLFHAGVLGEAPRRTDLAVLDRARRTASARRRLVAAPRGVAMGWAPEAEESLDRPVWPVALSAADLLCSPEACDVGLCGGEGCGWLFLDPGGRRRWCTMRGCGNRAKAARFYARRTGRAPQP